MRVTIAGVVSGTVRGNVFLVAWRGKIVGVVPGTDRGDAFLVAWQGIIVGMVSGTVRGDTFLVALCGTGWCRGWCAFCSVLRRGFKYGCR